MRKVVFFTFILLSCGILHASTEVQVTGQVKDKDSGEALQFCTISLFTPKDSLLIGKATNENGFFSFLLEKGSYKIAISYLGYKTDTLNIVVDSEDKFLGIFKLEPDANQLDEIVIEGTTSKHEIDKEVQLVTKELRDYYEIT